MLPIFFSLVLFGVATSATEECRVTQVGRRWRNWTKACKSVLYLVSSTRWRQSLL